MQMADGRWKGHRHAYAVARVDQIHATGRAAIGWKLTNLAEGVLVVDVRLARESEDE